MGAVPCIGFISVERIAHLPLSPRSPPCTTLLPSPFPCHHLDFPLPLLLHTRLLRKGLRAVCILRQRHRLRAVFIRQAQICRAGLRLVKLSTSDRAKPDASSSKTQRFDADEAKGAYDPNPAATGETLRHERAARRGLPRHGATSGAYMFHLVVLAE